MKHSIQQIGNDLECITIEEQLQTIHNFCIGKNWLQAINERTDFIVSNDSGNKLRISVPENEFWCTQQEWRYFSGTFLIESGNNKTVSMQYYNIDKDWNQELDNQNFPMYHSLEMPISEVSSYIDQVYMACYTKQKLSALVDQTSAASWKVIRLEF